MKTIYSKFWVVSAVAAVLSLAGCQREKPVVDPPKPAKRVFFMYDNIGSWFDDDVDEAGEAVAAGALEPADRVVVYERMSSGNVIYELVGDPSASNGFAKKGLKTYAAGENASLDAETIARVVGDVRALYPTADSWGFAFGSHGMGWLPASNTVSIARRSDSPGQPYEHPFSELWAERENPMTRYLLGYGEKLDVSEFARGLDEWDWDFVLLDDCFMASVEALYEMRTLADYIIASPTEIMWPGFHYGKVVSSLFPEWENDLAGSVVAVADAFVEDYRTGESGKLSRSAQCATVAVVKTSELEALAQEIKKFNLNFNELTTAEEVGKIQYYEGIIRPGHVFFDLDDYLSTIRKNIMPAEYNAFFVQLERTVVFKDHTDAFYSGAFSNRGQMRIDPGSYSGINIFIPWSSTASLFPDYQTTEWYKAVYAE